MQIDDLDTPCVLIDVDRARENIRRAQVYADQHGIRLRPHIKTHKLPLVAEWQMTEGAIGITCQKLGEAEIMAQAGLSDIFVSYNILGASKLGRLATLAHNAVLSVAADNPETIAGYAGLGIPLAVLVECDTGARRCGVQSPNDALDLARRILQTRSLAFRGLMTYGPKGGTAQTAAWLSQALALFTAAGIEVPVVSAGGTPDLWRAHEIGGLTEYRPGTYVYMDRSQVVAGAARMEDCALSVLATVVSCPTDDRLVVDAGSKILTSDLLGLDGFGAIVDHPDLRLAALSEEHGVAHLHEGMARSRLSVGDKVRIIPNHACVVSNMVDAVHLVSGSRLVETVPVAARGRVS